MTESQKLLSDYAKTRAEAAFRGLVEGYLDLVYSTALRLLNGDAHQAQDVAQMVFVNLARQAPRLGPETMLGGWLHRDTCFAAAKVMRGERRRQIREREAAEMNSVNAPDDTFSEVAPVLDEAINALGEEDRKAIILRFYEQRDLRSVGEALGGSEKAAQKRVARALDQLHAMLTRRGVALSGTALGGMLAAEAVSAAPIGLSTPIATTALANAVTSGGFAFTILKIMNPTALKVAAASSLVIAGIVAPLLQQQSVNKLREENQALRRQLDQTIPPQTAAGPPAEPMVTANRAEPLTEQQHRDLLRLRAEVGRLRSENSDLEKIREEYSAYRAAQARSARSIESGPATPPPGSLYVRTYFVDADALLSNIGAPAGITNGNSPGYPAQQTAIMQYFKDNDIVLGTNETVFLSDKSGRLIVRSSTENLEKIEALIQDVLQTESTPDRFGLRN